MRFAPAPVRPLSIVVGDASRDDLDPDAPYIRALELFCVRAGVKVLSLPVRAISGVGEAVSVRRPNLAVVAGGHVEDDTVARWVYAIRLAVGTVPVAVYRRRGQRRQSTELPSAAGEAQLRVLELTGAEQVRPPLAVSPTQQRSAFPMSGTRRASL
jgi:hypothetical protein